MEWERGRVKESEYERESARVRGQERELKREGRQE